MKRKYLTSELQKALNTRVLKVLKIYDKNLVFDRSLLIDINTIYKLTGFDKQVIIDTYKKIEDAFMNTDSSINAIHSSKIFKEDYYDKYIYYQGNIKLLDREMIGVVGSRNSTNKGELRTRELSEIIKKNNLVIASGLARGIDTVAHTMALENNIPNVMILANSLGKTYPPENAKLYDELIANNNLAISLTSFDQNISKYMFVERDFLLARLVKALIVPEAIDGSGTMHAINEATTLSKPIYVSNELIAIENLEWVKSAIYHTLKIYTKPSDIIKFYKNKFKKIEIPSEQLSLF